MYETIVGYEFEIEKKIRSLISRLAHVINFKYPYICDYHTTKSFTKEGVWRIERDSSLAYGAEFISPPQKLEQAIETMKMFLDIIKKHGSETSSRCGCHINMSLTKRGKILKINEDELLANINWRLMSSLWGNRLVTLNSYCRNINSMFAQIKHHTNSIHNPISGKAGIGRELFSKHHACITRKVSLVTSGNYYELRFPGGIDYHKYPDKIEQTVRHFSEILEKSIKSSCNDKTNKKIVSYINRLHAVNFTWSELLRKKTKLIPVIKTFANTYQEQAVYQTAQDRVLKTLAAVVTNVISNRSGNYSNPEQRKKLRTITCKNCLFYYFLKYAFFNYSRNENYVSFNPLYNFKLAGISLTVPKEESDLDKLWLAFVYPVMTEKEKIHIIKSIKSNKAKVIFKKMTKDNTYRAKIINAQKNKKKQLSTYN